MGAEKIKHDKIHAQRDEETELRAEKEFLEYIDEDDDEEPNFLE